MKDEPVEFSRPVRVDEIGADGMRVTVTADPDERRKLAARCAIPAVDRLTGEFQLFVQDDGDVLVTGEVSAQVRQRCVVTLEEVVETLKQAVERRFTRKPATAGHEVMIDPLEDADVDPLIGEAVDVGEVAAETMAMALDPYPRKPGVTFSAPGGDDAPPFTGPFAVLEAMRKGRSR